MNILILQQKKSLLLKEKCEVTRRFSFSRLRREYKRKMIRKRRPSKPKWANSFYGKLTERYIGGRGRSHGGG
jgi:hypothetical protein